MGHFPSNVDPFGYHSLVQNLLHSHQNSALHKFEKLEYAAGEGIYHLPASQYFAQTNEITFICPISPYLYHLIFHHYKNHLSSESCYK